MRFPGGTPRRNWISGCWRMWIRCNCRHGRIPGSLPDYELFYRVGKDYEKPEFGIHSIKAQGTEIPVVEQTALSKPFCRLLRFKRFSDEADVIVDLKDDPPVLVVAPLSGHHSTLLRDTVRTLLQRPQGLHHRLGRRAHGAEVDEGAFTLDDYVAYIREFHPPYRRRSPACDQRLPADRAGAGGVSLMAARGETTAAFS
jgi:poly(3-hydroxybutyrate) depolymerase